MVENDQKLIKWLNSTIFIFMMFPKTICYMVIFVFAILSSKKEQLLYIKCNYSTKSALRIEAIILSMSFACSMFPKAL